jgi:hypothetical protein
MNNASSCVRHLRSALPAVLLALGACQTGGKSTLPTAPETRRAEISNEISAMAEVVAVAPAERRLTLRRENGSSFDLIAGEGVRNFAQIAVGDVLRVRYKETLAASLRPAGEKIEPAEGAFLAARAKPGAKPGAGLGMAVSLRVKIESIDLDRSIVVFAPASGELIAHRLQTPEGREFARGLEIGDVVQLDYAESLALGIEKVAKP